jgi:hypothetical protein
MGRAETPDLDTGLPHALERRLARRYGRSAGGRMRLGMIQASRTGVRELTARLGRYDRSLAAPGRRLTKREVRQFRRLLDREAGGP